MFSQSAYLIDLNDFLKEHYLESGENYNKSSEQKAKYLTFLLTCFPEDFFDKICINWNTFSKEKNIVISYDDSVCTFLSNLSYFERFLVRNYIYDDKFDLFLDKLMFVITFYLDWIVGKNLKNT